MYILDWNHESLFYSIELVRVSLSLRYIEIIRKQLMTHFKRGSILIGYYKSHCVGIRVIYKGVDKRKILCVAIINIY